MTGMETKGRQRSEFAERLSALIGDRSQRTLAEEVERESGESVSPSAVSLWIKGENPPTPAKVFALERIMKLRPGSLSRLLGYLPVDAQPALTVLEAIDADSALSERDRRMLRAVYLTAVDR